MEAIKLTYHAWVNKDGSLIVERANTAIDVGSSRQRMQQDLGRFAATNIAEARRIAITLRGKP